MAGIETIAVIDVNGIEAHIVGHYHEGCADGTYYAYDIYVKSDLSNTLELVDLGQSFSESVNFVTSSGSTFGNVAILIWFFPSLRYGSQSTIPFARNATTTSSKSIFSSKSIVTLTGDLKLSSLTKGLASS